MIILSTPLWTGSLFTLPVFLVSNLSPFRLCLSQPVSLIPAASLIRDHSHISLCCLCVTLCVLRFIYLVTFSPFWPLFLSPHSLSWKLWEHMKITTFTPFCLTCLSLFSCMSPVSPTLLLFFSYFCLVLFFMFFLCLFFFFPSPWFISAVKYLIMSALT